jgi:hypothetical protein
MDFAEIRDEDEDEVLARRPGCLRGVFRLLLVLLVPLLLIVALLPTLMSSDSGRRWALQKINAAVAPAQVSFEQWSLGWLTALQLDRVTYTDAAQGADVKIEQVAFDRGLLRLIPVGVLNLGRVTLKKPEIALSLVALPPKPPVKKGEKRGKSGGFFLPVADLAMTLSVEDGRVSVTGSAPEPFVARQVVGSVAVDSYRKPIAVQTQMRVGDGLLALEGRVQSLRDLFKGTELDQPEKLTLKLVSVDLTEFRPLIQQATGEPWIQSGVAEGALTAAVKSLDQFTLEGGVLVNNLSVAAASQAGSPAGDLALMVDVAYDKKVIKVTQFELNSPWVKAEASGTLQAGVKAGVMTGAINAKADADLAAVARDFAPALRLSKGFKMQQGRLRAALKLEGGEEAMRVDAEFTTADLAMTVGGEPLVLKPAPSLTFKAKFPHGRWPEVEACRLKAPFADLYGSGTFDAGVVKGKLDLTLFTRDFKRMLKDAPPMVGAIYLDAATRRDNGRVALNLLLKMSDVAAELKPGQRTVVPQGAIKFDGFVPLKDGKPEREIQDATYALTLESGQAAGGWKRWAPAGRTEAGEARPMALRGFSLSSEMELDSVSKLLGGFLPASALRRVSAWQGLVIANATAEVAGGAVKARMNAAGQKIVAGSGDGGVWRVPDVRLEATLAQGGPKEGVQVEATVTGGGALERDGATVFAEPSAKLEVDALLAADGNSLRMAKFALASGLLEVQAQAEVTELATRCVVAAKGKAAVDFGQVTELLNAKGVDEFALAGRELRPFSFTAPLAGGAATVLSEGVFSGTAFLGSLKGLGLEAGPADLAVKLSQGVLKLAYEPTLNTGKLRLVPEVDAVGVSPVLLFPAQTRLFENVAITQEMVDKLLVNVNPLFQGSQSLGGTVSLSLRSCRIATGVTPDKGVAADMDILFKNLKLELGPSLRDLLSILKVKDLTYFAEQLPVHVVIKDGRIQVDPVKMVIDRQPVIFSGWVAFDGTIQYLIEVPLTDRLTGSGSGRLLKGTTVKIPVTGTVQHPRLDTRALQGAVGSMIKDIVSERAAEKVGTFLEKLQKELKK